MSDDTNELNAALSDLLDAVHQLANPDPIEDAVGLALRVENAALIAAATAFNGFLNARALRLLIERAAAASQEPEPDLASPEVN